MSSEINVLAMFKGEEQYVFLYDDANRVETLRTLGRFAADPELSFSWYDAAIMSKKIRDIANGEEIPETIPQPVTNESRWERSGNRLSFRHEGDIL